MAFTDLDADYRGRIENPHSYTEMRNLGDFLGYDPMRKFGFQAPLDITRGYLLFGYFTGDDVLQCQPWAAEPGKSGEPVKQHDVISRELIEIHQKNNNLLSFQRSDEALSREGWPMYLGLPSLDSDIAYDHVAYVGLFANSGSVFDEKLSAVARETEAAGALAGHVVCANFAGYVGTYRIQDGTIETVNKGLFGGLRFREYQVA